MRLIKGLAVVAIVMLFAPRALAQDFSFEVEHAHALSNCRGTLVVTPQQIEYRTEHKQDARIWEYLEIRQLTIVSPVELEVATYEDQKRMAGRDRVFKFKLLGGSLTRELSALLEQKVTRPLVTSVPPQTAGAPQFAVAAKHLHTLGGCAGTLKFYADRIEFESQTDARYWRYRDIQNFSHSERFRFEIVSYEANLGGAKAYNFELKEELPAQLYDYVWSRVYPLKFNQLGK